MNKPVNPKTFKVGIDNYGLLPLGLTPLEVLQWAKDHRAEGVAFSGLDAESRKLIDRNYLEEMRLFARENNLYLEWGSASHIPRDMTTWAKRDLFDINRKAAEEANILGTKIIRSCSGGLMRWNPENPATETLLKETAGALRAQKSMLEDHGVTLAIETHFEFTTFELRRLFGMCDAEPGGWLGICLDTMNLLTMLEDPVMATERILPWVVSTHIKDGGIVACETGLKSFPTAIGRGVIDLAEIIRMLGTLDREINLSIEDHGGEFDLPVNNPDFLKEFPDLKGTELSDLMKLVQETSEGLESGRIEMTKREDWADVCEERMAEDISNLRSF